MNDSMPTGGSCEKCGAPLAPGRVGDLCPRCLMALNLATETEIPDETGAQTTKSPPEAPLSSAEIAAHFPQLEILECLGRGGMGVVYRARQPKLNRIVALKILAPEKGADRKFAERFQREAQALARLNHPNIVAVHDFGDTDGLYYLVMEYVDGASLRQLLRSGKLAPEEALAIVPKICEALQFAHEKGIVHRDIKPENVLLDREGRVKIADFGIAKLVGQDQAQQALTEDRQVIGTPHYMAPEQVERPHLVDHRADIYSLGVVFYEMLTGELPLGKFAPPSSRMRGVCVGVRLDEVVLRTLEKEPERRYQHASQVKSDVETITRTRATPENSLASPVEDAPTTVHPETNPPLPGVTMASRPRLSRVAVVGACCAPFFFIVALLSLVAFQVEVEPGVAPPGPSWWQLLLRFTVLPLGLAAPFATTILGWIAVTQIRRSQGQLYGLGLALADGLLFPLLALDGLIFLVSILAAEAFAERGIGLTRPLTLIAATLVSLVADFLIARAVHRALAPSSAQRGGGGSGLGLALGIHAAAALGLLFLFVQIVSRMAATLAASDVALPWAALFTIQFGQLLRNWWFLLVPFLVAVDIGVCYLLARLPDRRPLRWWSATVLGSAVLVMALAAFSLRQAVTLTREEQDSRKADAMAPTAVDVAEAPFVARLPEGTVQLVAVSFHPSDNQRGWLPNGKPSDAGPFENRSSSSHADADSIAREFVFHISGTPPDASYPTCGFEPSASWAGGGEPYVEGEPVSEHHLFSATLPASADTVNVKLGVAMGLWESVADIPAGSSGMSSFTHDRQNWTVSFTRAEETAAGTRITVIHTVQGWETRITALGADGTNHTTNRSESRGTGSFYHTTVTFADLPLAELKEFHFEIRPYHWVEFRNVALKPGQSSRVQIVHAAD